MTVSLRDHGSLPDSGSLSKFGPLEFIGSLNKYGSLAEYGFALSQRLTLNGNGLSLRSSARSAPSVLLLSAARPEWYHRTTTEKFD